MCGIFGAIGRGLTEPALEDVFEVLHHRGPDGRGLFVDTSAKVTLAHTRLAVIDLVTGAQPLESEDGSIVLAANGEIYDFERIRSSLEAKGCRFRTKSDSEVIIHLYREFGLGCFEQLRGEFAFLLYDKAKGLLIAARDRFGIKPLYFSRLSDGFVFASEMKAIFASGLVVPKLNVAGFDPLAELDAENAQLPFEGIEHVPPASLLSIDLRTGDSRLTRYWSDEIPSVSAEEIIEPSDDEASRYAHTTLQELEEAVRLRLRADVSVGLYLSGGIDSAFVAALMKRNLESRPHSFSISFEGSERDERQFALRAAEVIGTEHHELVVTKKMLWDNLEQCLWFSELPFVTLAPVGKFLLSQEARKSVKVVLTGEGADEIFLGYRSFFESAISDTRKQRKGDRSLSAASRRLKLGGFLGALLRRASPLVFNKSQRAKIKLVRSRAPLHRDPEKPLINAIQEARIAAMPLDILCYLGDREEMAHSLEARLPFLDHKLYDQAKWIPADFKFRRGVEKAVLRDAAKGILPEDLRLRPKSGFMLTSEAVDFFGADRSAAESFRRYLSREAFARAGVFSFATYRMLRLFANAPPWKSFRLRRLRQKSNKIIMYMMQAHMLHEMFIEDPRWRKATSRPAFPRSKSEPADALIV